MLMFMKKVRKNKKGFTLTELIVVVAILGVLAAVATPLINGQIANARNSADTANATTLENAIKRAVAAGTLTLPDTAADIEGAIDGEITVMATQNTANKFMVNIDTGEVTVVPTGTAETTALFNFVNVP